MSSNFVSTLFILSRSGILKLARFELNFAPTLAWSPADAVSSLGSWNETSQWSCFVVYSVGTFCRHDTS